MIGGMPEIADQAEGTGAFDRLRARIERCTRCADALPLGPRPVLRGRPSARLLIVSQAPGSRVHESGVSFDDRSGDRLRQWLGLDSACFYDEARVAIMPIAFCYPGRAGSGDRPPSPHCAPLWHDRLLAHFTEIELTLLVGGYAVRYYLPETRRQPLGAVLAEWRRYRPARFVLPHPSWRSALWEQQNPWFAAELLPELRAAVAAATR
jgi:uracil-DNA glycosylase